MKVADLQQHLADLARLLEVSGAKKVGDELNDIREGLRPFRDLTLKAFADFLVKADTYARDGIIPVGTGGRRPAAGKAAKAPPVDLTSISNETHDLYERAASPSVTPEQVEGLVSRLGGLSKDGLAAVAERIGLKGMRPKSKPAIQKAIGERIIARKGASQRAGLIDRLSAIPNASAAPMS